jgi:hypothetical protein
MGSITLTNILQFVEQPGRTVTKNVGQLDRMTVPFIGPYYAEVPFQEGHPDTVYPLMFCTGWTENYNGGLKELTVNYAGRTDSDWQNDILISVAASEKELSYSRMFEYMETAIIQRTPTYPQGLYAMSVGLDNFLLHYVGEIVTYKYVYYGTPVQKIATIAQILSQYTVMTGKGSVLQTFNTVDPTYLAQQFPGPYGYSGPHQRLTQFTFNQVIDKWYECQSSTEARYEVP